MKNHIAALLLGGLFIMGCKNESAATESWQSALCQPGALFPSAIALTDEDAAVTAKFGKACRSIVKLQGLQFKDAKNAYLCEAYLERDKLSPALTEIFGADNMAQADILRREGFMGKQFSAVILTDAQNHPDAVVLRSTVLGPLLQSIETAEAAAAWAQLTGHSGGDTDGRAYCNAAVTATETGWRFDKVEAFINCHPSQILSLEVTKSGKVSVLSRENKMNPDGTVSAVCID